jgi:mono/diheme cytochrome c family protein
MRITLQTLLLLYLQLILLMGSSSVFASHSFGGMDLCALYPEVMPPGLTPDQLPDAGGPGAVLMQGYCTQCHALPGPGRHSAEEWPQVLDRMLLLMDVADRFGGLLGNVKTPSSDERDLLRSYLVLHALKPMTGTPQGAGASAFQNHCSACHALPDPAQYNHIDWPGQIKKMQRHMVVMKYSPPSADTMMQIQFYLQKHNHPAATNPDAVSDHLAPAATGDAVSYYDRSFSAGSWLALGPFFLFVAIGLARWQKNYRHVNRQPSVNQTKT